jgi:hypothetical protein
MLTGHRKASSFWKIIKKISWKNSMKKRGMIATKNDQLKSAKTPVRNLLPISRAAKLKVKNIRNRHPKRVDKTEFMVVIAGKKSNFCRKNRKTETKKLN